MSETLKPCPFCGGDAKIKCGEIVNRYNTAVYRHYHVECMSCGVDTRYFDTEADAIEAWNRAMGERTAKVIEHDASITDTDGYKYQRSEYLCGACKKKVLGGDEYCSHCGCRLDWGEDIPMEYFENGGI